VLTKSWLSETVWAAEAQ